jgi:hypothetical protein
VVILRVTECDVTFWHFMAAFEMAADRLSTTNAAALPPPAETREAAMAAFARS